MQAKPKSTPPPAAARPANIVDPVCPDDFIAYFKALQSTVNSIAHNPDIPAEKKHEIATKVALAFALEFYGEPVAVAMASRFLALNEAMHVGLMRKIGETLFDDADMFARIEGPAIIIKGVVLFAAALADLRFGQPTFTDAALSNAILTVPAGCTLADCAACPARA